jgi:hypothetical protein
VDLANTSAGEFGQDVGDEAEPYAVRDVEDQRQDGQEGLVETLPRDEPDKGQSVLTGYKPRSGLFLFQASQAIESSQRPIMAE